jgi:hypothetical protein
VARPQEAWGRIVAVGKAESQGLKEREKGVEINIFIP